MSFDRPPRDRKLIGYFPGAAHRKAPPRAPVSPLPSWRLKRVQTLIDERVDEAWSTLPDLFFLAAAAGVSRMHFAAQFRAATGMRPHDYLLARRIFRAMAQMIDSDEPLVLLALSVGFQSQNDFTTVFKRMTGTTPAAWRAVIQASPRAVGATPSGASAPGGNDLIDCLQKILMANGFCEKLNGAGRQRLHRLHSEDPDGERVW